MACRARRVAAVLGQRLAQRQLAHRRLVLRQLRHHGRRRRNLLAQQPLHHPVASLHGAGPQPRRVLRQKHRHRQQPAAAVLARHRRRAPNPRRPPFAARACRSASQAPHSRTCDARRETPAPMRRDPLNPRRTAPAPRTSPTAIRRRTTGTARGPPRCALRIVECRAIGRRTPPPAPRSPVVQHPPRLGRQRLPARAACPRPPDPTVPDPASSPTGSNSIGSLARSPTAPERRCRFATRSTR